LNADHALAVLECYGSEISVFKRCSRQTKGALYKDRRNVCTE
jgi:hypothetical protein